MTAPLAEFRLAQPSTVKEAIAACLKHPGSRFVAGGTDLLVNMRRGISSPDLLVDLSGIDELTEIKTDERGVTIGAGVTIAALARNAAIASQYRALAQAAAAIAGPGHRVMATVGGNLCLDTRCIYYNQSEWWRSANAYCLKNRGDICHVAPQGQRCHAAFSGDLAPALLVFGAEVDIAGAQGQRRIPLSDLYVEDGKAHLALAAGELIVAVHLPAAPPPSAYEKVRVRGAIDFPLAGVAVALAASGSKHRFAAHRADRHQFAAVPARRHGSLCRPTGRREAAAGDRSAGAEAGAADADHDCIGQLSPRRRRRAGTASDRKAFRRRHGLSLPLY